MANRRSDQPDHRTIPYFQQGVDLDCKTICLQCQRCVRDYLDIDPFPCTPVNA
jgi:hypothetical protein